VRRNVGEVKPRSGQLSASHVRSILDLALRARMQVLDLPVDCMCAPSMITCFFLRGQQTHRSKLPQGSDYPYAF